MSRDFPEGDWKIFKKVKDVALERYCERVLAEITRAGGDAGKTAYERYIDIYKLMLERDETLAASFDGFSRSKALMQLHAWKANDLITEQEWRFFPRRREMKW